MYLFICMYKDADGEPLELWTEAEAHEVTKCYIHAYVCIYLYICIYKDIYIGSVLFVRVLCASAVRVGVCGVCVCLGALNNDNKYECMPTGSHWSFGRRLRRTR